MEFCDYVECARCLNKLVYSGSDIIKPYIAICLDCWNGLEIRIKEEDPVGKALLGYLEREKYE